ncbi:tetratricopeptide repeat protein [Oleiagrimonas sp. C23AA]|uniref:tetratricopeptide repeat protein n=1 Tax=Oleiagrimonas sp. C23AA TaxID=2719047 RepID=UPI001422BC25|nr:tetratricopeptide repeat protein [Oleiagrimonas sp. C23AA]NII10042.1 tetratricopeptide repeat protein [Oleiagrimonas sp. C23AA]
MRLKVTRLLLPSAAVLMLAACAPTPTQVKRKGPPPPTHAQMMAAIRHAGKTDHSAVQVRPVRDPAAQAYLDQAHAANDAGKYQQAADALDHALKITPKAPDLLQDRAELALELGNYARAESLAQQSYALGPKLGPLCARNWQTILEMRKLAGDTAGMAKASKHVGQCRKKGVVRM